MKNLIVAAVLVMATFFVGQTSAQDYNGTVTVIVTQDIDIGCLAVALERAALHQCQSPRPAGCFLEKAAVGFGSYLTCTRQARLNRRQRLRRAFCR